VRKIAPQTEKYRNCGAFAPFFLWLRGAQTKEFSGGRFEIDAHKCAYFCSSDTVAHFVVKYKWTQINGQVLFIGFKQPLRTS